MRKHILWHFEDDFWTDDFDAYSENFDEEEAISRGWKPRELAFLRGFKESE